MYHADQRRSPGAPVADRTGAWVPWSTSSRPGGRTRRAFLACRPEVLALEGRTLLSADLPLSLAGLTGELEILPAWEAGADLAAGAVAGGLAAAGMPLSSIPALNSLPTALASLYLDFDGHAESGWGGYWDTITPAFDQDGDPTTFSAGELESIYQIWAQVAEDYAPFQINVTTVEPPSFADGVALRVAIGGAGDWLGIPAGGVAFVNSFTNHQANTVYVFPAYLANGTPKYVAEAVSHEAAHGFGVLHQSLYSGETLVSDYYAGPDGSRAPIMGSSYFATRGLWWYGTTTSAYTFQDDMAVIARAENGFGYRPDDHGDTAATATPLTVIGTQVSGAGVITTTDDLDFFSFTTGAGAVSLTVSVPEGINNLDARLELHDESGATLAVADPSDSFGATIEADLAAGRYYLVVASHGGYGDVGQYTLGGTIVEPPAPVAAPGGLTARPAGAIGVALTWTDHATNETGYRVERSLDGTIWEGIAELPAGSTAHLDATARPGTTYLYRVIAFNPWTTSGPSEVATVTTVPAAPGNLTLSVVSPNRIDLNWLDVAGEIGYRIQRSTDGGTTWVEIGATTAGVTTFADASLAPQTTCSYRVLAINAGGTSAPGAVATATTPAAPTAPEAPAGLAAVAVSSWEIRLNWSDRSANEAGFVVERSTDGRTWTQLAQVGADQTSYADTTVLRRRTYWYRVSAFNGVGSSAASALAYATTPRWDVPSSPLPVAALPVAAPQATTSTARRAWLTALDRALEARPGWSRLAVMVRLRGAQRG